MKALSAIEKIEVDNFASNYLAKEYKKCLSIGRHKKGNNNNNAWQHII